MHGFIPLPDLDEPPSNPSKLRQPTSAVSAVNFSKRHFQKPYPIHPLAKRNSTNLTQ
jgi:hypothetical protein